MEMNLENLIVFYSGHPKGLVSPMNHADHCLHASEARRGPLSPSPPINQCLGNNKRINRKGFWFKMMSGWEPPDAAFLSIPLKTLMDENALRKLPPSLQTSRPHHMMYVLYQVCH